MPFHAIPVTKDMDDYGKLESLAHEAFPPEERLTPDTILEMTKEGNLDFWALYDESFVGFMVVQTHKNLGYLFFLAIEESVRSKGYGGLAIQTLKNLYPEKQHVVDFEMPDPSAPNNSQREKRRAFYLKNGYKPTGHYLSYLGVDYEIVCMSDDFDFEMFKEMMTTIKVEEFNPVYFQK